MGGYSPSFSPESSKLLEESGNPYRKGEMGPPRNLKKSWMELNTPPSNYTPSPVGSDMMAALVEAGKMLSGGSTQLRYPADPKGRSNGELLATDWNPGRGQRTPAVGNGAEPATSSMPAARVGRGGGGGRPASRTQAPQGDVDLRDIASRGRVEEDDMSKELKALISRVEGKKEFDLSPLLALTDSWTGSRLSQGYERPMNEDERDKMVLGLKNKVVERGETMQAKRDYLAQMAKQERDRLQDKQDNRDLQITLHQMDNNARMAIEGTKADAKTEEGRKKIPKALKQSYGVALSEIAKKRAFDPKNPLAKSKGNPEEVHQEALAMAQAAVDQGLTDDLQQAYGKYVSVAMSKPNGYVTGD